MSKIVAALVSIITFFQDLFGNKYDTGDKLQGNGLPLLKDGANVYPGHMAFASKGGEYFHGCRVAHFRTVNDLNAFFLPGKAGHLKLVAELIPQRDGSVVAVYTNVLSAEDQDDLRDFSMSQNEFLAEKKEARRQAKIKELEEKEAEERETKRLAEVGRIHEANCKKTK